MTERDELLATICELRARVTELEAQLEDPQYGQGECAS